MTILLGKHFFRFSAAFLPELQTPNPPNSSLLARQHHHHHTTIIMPELIHIPGVSLVIALIADHDRTATSSFPHAPSPTADFGVLIQSFAPFGIKIPRAIIDDLPQENVVSGFAVYPPSVLILVALFSPYIKQLHALLRSTIYQRIIPACIIEAHQARMQLQDGEAYRQWQYMRMMLRRLQGF